MVTELTNVLIYIGLFLIMILVITFIAIIIELEKLDEEERLRGIIQRAKEILVKRIESAEHISGITYSKKAYIDEQEEIKAILDEVDNES